MRLYLSSYQLGDHPEAFSAMVDGDRHGWVVMNALDGLDEKRRTADLSVQIANLASIGLTAHNFDLRHCDPSNVANQFGAPDFVWVRGGNVFTLRAALSASGLDAVLVQRLREDAIVYAGFSAGACVLAPSLDGLELCDSPATAAKVYGNVRVDGLEILDRPVVPHLHSPQHPETDVLGVVASQYDGAGQPYWALRDGQALITTGGEPRVI